MGAGSLCQMQRKVRVNGEKRRLSRRRELGRFVGFVAWFFLSLFFFPFLLLLVTRAGRVGKEVLTQKIKKKDFV